MFLGCFGVYECRLAAIIEHHSNEDFGFGHFYHLDGEESHSHFDTVDKSERGGDGGSSRFYVLPVTSALAVISLAAKIHIEIRAARTSNIIFTGAFVEDMTRLKAPVAERSWKIES